MSGNTLPADHVRRAVSGRSVTWRRLRAATESGPAISILAMIAVIAWAVSINRDVLSYTGLDLLLSTAVPLILGTLSQMIIIALGDIDVSVGFFIGLVNVVVARVMSLNLATGSALLVALIFGYVVMGFITTQRKLPSIIVTLGASFIWLGVGLMVSPSPGGSSPAWLGGLFNWNPPLVPFPILVGALAAVAGFALIYRSRLGVLIRGAGSQGEAVANAGWNLLLIRTAAYGVAGVFAVLAGLAVTGITGSGDISGSSNYTLLTIAAVILGGGEFSGGKTSAVGAVTGAVTISAIGSVLAILNLSSSLQTGAQGLVLMAAIAGRRLVRHAGSA